MMDRQRLAMVGNRGRRLADGGESVDDCTMTKAVDDRHNNQPSTQG
jgi:hypothetical protein